LVYINAKSLLVKKWIFAQRNTIEICRENYFAFEILACNEILQKWETTIFFIIAIARSSMKLNDRFLDMFSFYNITRSTYNAQIKQKAQKTYKMYDKVDFLFIIQGYINR